MKNNIILLCLFCLFPGVSYSQNISQEAAILFYNVENLFDLKDDPETSDEEFTPKGERRWTYKRFNQKIQNISKVILSAAGWASPTLIALCEVENRYVLEQLISQTPLQSFPYKIIHKESPDRRGIDVALIYNEKDFYPLEYKSIPLRLENDSILKSREILYASGILKNTDTLHIFVNHWPSRYSGLLESRHLRNLAAQTLKKEVEFLQQKYSFPKIVMVGDFNDQPTDESLSVHLGAIEYSVNNQDVTANQIYNLSFPWLKNDLKTIKYQSQWSVFDQIIVSGSLLEPENKIFIQPGSAQIVSPSFLLEKDERYGGLKTNRTYNGFRYQGGFSDHLPVLLKINIHP